MLKNPISLDYQWCGINQLNEKAPIWLYNRLVEQGSLTALLKSQCTNFSVQVLGETLMRPPSNIAKLLGDTYDHSLCREVLLLCDGKPHVYAQSWITVEANELGLSNMGNKPLGERLFQESDWQRGELEVCHIQCSQSRKQLAELFCAPAVPFFARRSIFTNQNAKVLVCEIFNNGIE
ncbi:chorismate lyase [Pseudoalteromonas luteoviolacea]|uniref:chorismate--pyruvate lyase family protein n=1 Tax=Pseudoalteromonas luteoviolacea TaxID=43657 RepID=UPI001B38E6CE|nr:chorismate lyase [Pseudoalteromonas luteoviolacea]MBQ4813540.1 chorismate lyase [Pseudoalteromonas luteoviolacea]